MFLRLYVISDIGEKDIFLEILFDDGIVSLVEAKKANLNILQSVIVCQGFEHSRDY